MGFWKMIGGGVKLAQTYSFLDRELRLIDLELGKPTK